MNGEEAATARSVRLEVVREGERLDLELTPQVIRDTNALGRYYFRPVLGVTRMGTLVDGPSTRVLQLWRCSGTCLARNKDVERVCHRAD